MTAIGLSVCQPLESDGSDAVSGQRVHFIGIGGCGMSAAAHMLIGLGAKVSGSDREAFDGLGRLTTAGATVRVGHHSDHIDHSVDLVVVSAAVPDDNVELEAARRIGIRIIKYVQLLDELMRPRVGVCIAGTHGKSTTTAMTIHAFRVAGFDPSFVVGAESPQLGGGSGVGGGRHLVVEACEFDRSFLHLRPTMAAVLNIEPDHLDCFADLDDIAAAFAAFAENVDGDGLLVVNGDDAPAGRAVAGATARVEDFGFGPGVCWRATNLESDRGRLAFDVRYRDRFFLRTRLAVPGRHSVSDALAAVALAHHAGADADAIAEAMQTYAGLERRMSRRGECGGVTVVDDYAHHPTEIRLTLAALRERYRPERTWVVFQPHQHCRTRLLMEEFADCFADADVVVVPDIYTVRESAEERRRTSSEHLVERIHARGVDARYLPGLADAAAHVRQSAQTGDLVVTMGAGDVWKVADELVGST